MSDILRGNEQQKYSLNAVFMSRNHASRRIYHEPSKNIHSINHNIYQGCQPDKNNTIYVRY